MLGRLGGRYVTRERLEAMLDYEYLQCNLTLRTQRGDRTAFFAFADTLTTKVPPPPALPSVQEAEG